MKKAERKPSQLSRKELANALDMSTDTVTKFLKLTGITHRNIGPADLRIIKKHCHPLFFKMTRETLAKIYGMCSEKLTGKLFGIGISHQGKLSYEDLQNVYWKLGLPDLVTSLHIENQYLLREDVKRFYQYLGITMPEKWYKFYFETLYFKEEELRFQAQNGYFDPEALQYVPNFSR
jgi:hypothetical protein